MENLLLDFYICLELSKVLVFCKEMAGESIMESPVVFHMVPILNGRMKFPFKPLVPDVLSLFNR